MPLVHSKAHTFVQFFNTKMGGKNANITLY